MSHQASNNKKSVNASSRHSATLDRRRFLSATTSAVVAMPYFIPSSVLAAPGRSGPNDKLNIGIIGTGNRVGWLASHWGNPTEMRIAALADCSAEKMGVFIEGVKNRFPESETCNRYVDYREMLGKEELDGVFITTPTHGRVLPCIHACQAGVDIYAEKPVTLTIDEGLSLLKAVNQHKIVFQSGTQARSIAVNDWAVQQLADGKLGAVKHVRMPNYDGPIDYQPLTTETPIPEGMDWDKWCNQAPLFPYDAKIAARLEDGWSPYRPFDGGGERWGLTGFGTHSYDQVLWAIGRDTETPVQITPHKPRDPTCGVTMRFADGLVIDTMDEIGKGPAFGGVITCENGKMEINRGRVATNPKDLAAQLPEFESPHTNGVSHVQNWLDCIRSRAETRCPIDVAHRQSVICHIITVARELGRELRYDAAVDRFIGDDEANQHPSVTRPRRAGYELPVGR